MKSILRSIKWIILTQAILCIASTVPIFEKTFDSNSLTFPLNSVENYVKIEVKGSNPATNYVLSAYKSSSSTDKRIQLAQSFNGITTLYLSPEQARSGSILLEIECSDSSSCSGNIKAEELEKIVLKSGEPVNYYVTEETKNMDFLIEIESSSSSSSSSTDIEIANVWARGGSISSTLTSADTETKRDKSGDYYLIKNASGEMTLNVKAGVGDLINVGFIEYKRETTDSVDFYKPTTNIYVDEATITGYLKKNVLEKVCYNVNLRAEKEILFGYYGTGVIFTKIAESYGLFMNGTRASDNPKEDVFDSGYFSIHLSKEEVNKGIVACVSFPDPSFEQYKDINEIVYTYQFTSGNSNEKNLNIYEPQVSGLFYPRMTNKGSVVAFVGTNLHQKIENHFNLMSNFGFPVMTVIECTNYPLCSLDEETLKKGISPRNVNRFSSLAYESKNTGDLSSISKYQTLLVVRCEEINDIEFDLICSFGTIIEKEHLRIPLMEDNYFNQFALEDQTYRYQVQLSGESKVQKIFIDVMTFIGEVEVIPELANIPYSMYRAANKIYISVKTEGKSENIEGFSFSVKALTKTYYTILVNFGRDEKIEEDSLIKNDLQTGIPYLITIDPTKIDSYAIANKVISFHNEKYYDQTPMMVNFNSLNCKMDVGIIYVDQDETTILEEINEFEDFSHIYLENSDIRYYSERYEFRINITGFEPSQYKGKLCKIFTSAVEISSEHGQITRDIIVPDNTPQRVMFEDKKYNHISYGYVLVDFENDLLISFNLKHPAQYKIKLYYENKKRELEEIIVANDVLYLSSTEWEDRCRDKTRICYIQLDITLDQVKDVAKPILEVAIKSIDSKSKSVSYLSKGQVRVDYLQNQLSQYYYTEIGEDDIGYINVNFLRSSGKMYARLIEANAKTETGANWRKQYVLPYDDSFLSSDSFLKKVFFESSDYNCANGCFLLINVFSDVKDDDIPIRRNYPFSIVVQSFPAASSAKDIPIIKAYMDEFIVGNVDVFAPKETIYELYQVILTGDAKQVIIDFQSISACLFVNVGNTRPTIKKADFSFYQYEKDSIHIMSKEDILKIYKQRINPEKNDLNGITLTIGVWTNITDSLFTTPFAFVVRLENGNENDIYRVNSDQKALCKTKKMSDKDMYRCVYVIEYDFFSDFNALFIYPSVQEKSAFFSIYANYINQTDYEMGKEDHIKNLIPTDKEYHYTNKDLNSDYLYVEYGLIKEYYVLVSVETNIETVVELMSSLYIFNNVFTANPSTSQLFMTPTGDNFTLSFPSDTMVMVNIRGIGGEAEVYWESSPNNKYYLKGRDDRLSISSDISGNNHNLRIKSTYNITDDIGFIFYVNYDVKFDDNNFDKLIFDKTVNYIYTDNDLPIIYYGKLNHSMEENDYYDIFYSFNVLENGEEKTSTFYNETPFEISAFITQEKTIIDLKSNPELSIDTSKRIFGFYDYSLRTGIIRVTQKAISDSGIKPYEKPYIYIKIAKREHMRTVRYYKRISLEMTAVRNKPEVPVSEQSYQFGSLSINEKERKYRLRTDKRYTQMNIQFSSIEEALTVSIEGTNKELKLVQNKYGKILYTLETDPSKLYVYLVVKRKDQTKNNQENFLFQYTHSNKTETLYNIKDTKVDVKIEELKGRGPRNRANYTIKVSPVDDVKGADVNYIVKISGLRRNTTLKMPFIAPRSDRMIAKEYYNPKPVDNKLDLSIKDVVPMYGYAQVIAQITDKDRIEYLSYDIVDLSGNRQGGGNDGGNSSTVDNNKAFIITAIIVGSLLILIVIVLIIVIVAYQRKNKDLLEKVQSVSFQQERGENNNDTDNLLIN